MTQTQTCTHESIIEIATSAFLGAVVDRDQNRAAHGCVTVTEECSVCGARRRTNINQCHREEGDWGPTRREREAEIDRMRRELPPVPPRATFRRGSESVEIVCYPDGTLGGRGAFLPGLAEQYPGLDAAQARRRAWLAIEAAREVV